MTNDKFIDWSKAPEGTTQAYCGDNSAWIDGEPNDIAFWERVENDVIYEWGYDGWQYVNMKDECDMSDRVQRFPSIAMSAFQDETYSADITDNINTIEDLIMECSQVTGDIDVMTEYLLDSPDYDEDTMANALIGTKSMYDIRFAKLVSEFHNMIEKMYAR